MTAYLSGSGARWPEVAAPGPPRRTILRYLLVPRPKDLVKGLIVRSRSVLARWRPADEPRAGAARACGVGGAGVAGVPGAVSVERRARLRGRSAAPGRTGPRPAPRPVGPGAGTRAGQLRRRACPARRRGRTCTSAAQAAPRWGARRGHGRRVWRRRGLRDAACSDHRLHRSECPLRCVQRW